VVCVFLQVLRGFPSVISGTLMDVPDNNEDMQALRISIVTINHALTVSLLMMCFS
jgi:hypothetical protein